MTSENESLSQFDDREEPNEDSYETTDELFERMENNYGLDFQLDSAATKKNTKCMLFLHNALYQEWQIYPPDGCPGYSVDVWCNPPHSLNEEFIKRADAQHKKYNINICMIVPTNCQSMVTWHKLIENELEVITENHPLLKRPTFLKNKRKTEHNSRNAYRVIIWRKSNDNL